MKKLTLLLLAVLLALTLIACDNTPGGTPGTTDGTPAQTDANGQPVETQPGDTNSGNNQTPNNNNNSNNQTPSAPSTIVLTFDGTKLSTSVQDTGITVDGGAFVITRGGSYELKGDLSNGQIKVAVPMTEQVELIFNNFTASCNTSAPLYIESAD